MGDAQDAKGRALGATSWVRGFPGAITICDTQGIILEMNDSSARMFERDGGRALIGKSLFDCHPEPARSKLRRLIEERRTNAYTIEKNGVKKLIYQVPWVEEGEYRGFVELALEIPFDLPHFVRGG
jgi:hypothetical protein